MRVIVTIAVLLILSAGCRREASDAQTPAVERPEVFFPAGPEERQIAVGPLDDLEPGVRKAFEDPHGFEPIGSPTEGDWLAEFQEPAQPYLTWKFSNPNRPTLRRRTIVIQPIGAFPAERSPPLRLLERYVEAFFDTDARVQPPVSIDTIEPTERINTSSGRRQLLTSDLLAWLAEHVPDDAYCVIGVTMVDLYPKPEWNFVFGQATLRRRVGVYSFARTTPGFPVREPEPRDLPVMIRRSIKIMAHEIGHMYAVTHCVFHRCVMNGSNSLEEADAQPQHACPVCLRKLYDAAGFEPVRRYRALEKLWHEVGADDEVEWVQKRLTRL